MSTSATFIVGMSQFGKSILAKLIAKGCAAGGHDVVVFDKTRSTGWPATAKKFYDATPDELNELLYAGRHKGLFVFVIAHRYKMIPPNSRSQFSTFYIFRQKEEDIKAMEPEVADLPVDVKTLKKFEFILATTESAKILSLVKENDNFVVKSLTKQKTVVD